MMVKKRKQKKSLAQPLRANDSFNRLMSSYIMALEDNSKDIIDALNLLQHKTLTVEDKKVLNSIGKELKKLNEDLDSIG